jgi:hypothetical protein
MELQYQQQIKEYQSNINHAIEETEKLRKELKQFQEENLLKEKQTNELINSLKQDNEKIQTELKHRGRSAILLFIPFFFNFDFQNIKRIPLSMNVKLNMNNK